MYKHLLFCSNPIITQVLPHKYINWIMFWWVRGKVYLIFMSFPNKVNWRKKNIHIITAWNEVSIGSLESGEGIQTWNSILKWTLCTFHTFIYKAINMLLLPKALLMILIYDDLSSRFLPFHISLTNLQKVHYNWWILPCPSLLLKVLKIQQSVLFSFLGLFHKPLHVTIF